MFNIENSQWVPYQAGAYYLVDERYLNVHDPFHNKVTDIKGVSFVNVDGHPAKRANSVNELHVDQTQFIFTDRLILRIKGGDRPLIHDVEVF
jgi:hypothetical protein